MEQVRVIVVDDSLVPAISGHLLGPAAQVRCLVGGDLKPISLGPVVHPGDYIRRIGIASRVLTTCVGNRSIFKAVKLHDRDGETAGIAGRQLLVGIEVEGSRDWRKGSNALRRICIAS